MAISREDAFRLAAKYIQDQQTRAPGRLSERLGQSHLPSIREVLTASEVGRPPSVYGLSAPIEDCWIAYLHSVTTGLHSSQVVILSRDSGTVLYFGSANDEG